MTSINRKSGAFHVLWLILLAIIFVADVHAVEPQASWKQRELIRTFWCEPPADDEHLARLRRERFSLTWCPAEALDAVKARGLKAMIHDETILKPYCLDDPVKKQKLEEMIARVKTNQALDGYWIADEPAFSQLKDVARLVAFLRERDPAHFSYVNALPIYAFSPTEYTRYVREFISVIKPQIYSFAHYHLFKSFDGLQYFQDLETVRQETSAAGIPFIGIIQACTYDEKWRMPDAKELRWLVYTNLAYGAKGISYFLYWGPKAFGGLYQDGSRMPAMDTVNQLNAEIARLSPVLLRLRSAGVYHSEPLPLGTQGIQETSPIRIVDRGHGQFVVGLFTDGKGTNYAMIVNRDYRKAHTAKLEVRKGTLESEFLIKENRFVAAPAADWFARTSIKLDPGEGRLFIYTVES